MNNLKSLIKFFLSLSLFFTLSACGSKNDPQPGPETTPETGIQVPDFAGMTREDAETWIEENKVDPDIVFFSYEYNETVAKDKIFEQNVSAGDYIGEEGLNLTISNGVNPSLEIEFPDFSTMTVEEIQQWFLDEHFEHVSIEYVYQKDTPVGQFLGTNAEDNKAYRNQPVIIRISGDPKQAGVAVDVPDMTGWEKAKAEEWANTNQITIDYSQKHNATVPYGCVVSFTPAAGSEIVKGDHIQVLLSLGNSVDAVNLTSMSRDQIEAWGQENGIQISWIQCWNAVRSGTIYWNEPNSGTMKMGDIMRCYISVGPIPVKDYTGLQYQGNFMGWLNSINTQYNSTANLKVAVTEQEVPDQESGIILNQNPSSGYLNPGETINLLVTKKVEPAPRQTVNIPSMAGYSEYDFKHALHAYGVWEGTRTTQYSDFYAEDYIIYNDTGEFELEDSVDYVVSVGSFTLDEHSWAGRDYFELEDYINQANRRGAGVFLSPSFIDTGSLEEDNEIFQVEGPLEDGSIHVRVGRYYGPIGGEGTW